jgi:hypothetical protein
MWTTVWENPDKRAQFAPVPRQSSHAWKLKPSLPVLVFVGAVLSRVFMVAGMGIHLESGLAGMPVHMAMDMLVGVLMGMDLFPMPVFMAVGMGMLMDMQMCVFRNFFHGNLPAKNPFSLTSLKL